MYSASAFLQSFLMQAGCTPGLRFFSPRWGLKNFQKGGARMESKYLVELKARLNTALHNLEDTVEEAQQNHHAFISQTTSIRRTIRSAIVNLELAEKNKQAT